MKKLLLFLLLSLLQVSFVAVASTSDLTPTHSKELIAVPNVVMPTPEAQLHTTITTAPNFSESLKQQMNVSGIKVTQKAGVFAKLKMAKAIKKAIKQQPDTAAGGGKSQIIALILVLVVGTLGIHRFYLGYIGIGIAQLLTLGGCGIWTLIDLI
jgi:hypothetical protein